MSNPVVSPELKAECIAALSKAKLSILQKDKVTFLVALLLRMEIVITLEIKTLATDGLKIYINPIFFLEQKKDWQIFILLHEILHVAYDHCGRKGDRQMRRWNMACDYVVNLDLKHVGFSLPSGALYDFQYRNMSTEQIYDLLDEDDENSVSDFLEDVLPTQRTLTQSEMQERQQQLESMLLDAATQAEMSEDAASIPPNIERILEGIRKPKVNWRVVLKRFCTDLAKTGHTWKRPNRRMLPMYLPTQESTKLASVLFAIDVSGSIDQDTFFSFCSEVASVLQILKPKDINLMQFDHSVQDVTRIRKVPDLYKVEFVGGGGTQLEPVMQHFIKSNDTAMIVLTDGHFSKYITDPQKPVIWVVYDNEQWTSPFGRVVHFHN